MSTADSTQTVALLLERVRATVKKLEDQYKKTGMAYNVFKVAGIAEREVIMCSVLADLLNPKGQHYQGTVYFKLFMDMVVNPLAGKTIPLNLAKLNIMPEYKIDDDRRIDIVISDGSVFIPIEVKIRAGEQKQQLADYAVFSRKMNSGSSFIPVLFLTPDGRESNEAAKSDYVCVSFEKHIIPWLVQCLNCAETDKASPIREILKQYIKAIKSFCGCMEDDAMKNAISALIMESEDSYAAALSIAQTVDELNGEIDNKVWDIFREGEIFRLVKNKFPDTEYLETDAGDWLYLSIPVGSCVLSVHYDMSSISVELDDNLSFADRDKIVAAMSRLTGAHNEAGEDWGDETIWVTTCCIYPGLEGIEDDNLYLRGLYKIYTKNPQAVADKIVSMAQTLKGI